MDGMQKLESTCEARVSRWPSGEAGRLALTVEVDLGLGDAVEHQGVTMDGEQFLACEITDKIHAKWMQRLVPGLGPQRADLVFCRRRHDVRRVWWASAV